MVLFPGADCESDEMRESPDISRPDDYASFQHPLKNNPGIDPYVDENEVGLRGDALQDQARKFAMEKGLFHVDETYRPFEMLMISQGRQSPNLGKDVDIKGFLDLSGEVDQIGSAYSIANPNATQAVYPGECSKDDHVSSLSIKGDGLK